MKQIALYAAFIILIGLLAGMLYVLLQINHQGLSINVTGQVELANATTAVTGEVRLAMPEPVNLIATGPGEAAIQTSLAVVSCPKCGGSMIPIQWNLLNGKIEWRCLDCGYILGETLPTTP